MNKDMKKELGTLPVSWRAVHEHSGLEQKSANIVSQGNGRQKRPVQGQRKQHEPDN
jgi:hypothetical protein